LQGVRWIRLAYLADMMKKGQSIKRCQLLEPEAFGDPATAAHLIVLSHRWMDSFKCDMETHAYPQGLRLTTMLAKLEAHFSPAGFGVGTSLKDRWCRCWQSITGGSDVLVFFDFMSLPQQGISDSGELIPRTREEKETFDRCLPNMGSLYSMFPVLVCAEVADGVEPYETSGWCFLERSIATLGHQLHTYSPEFSIEYGSLDDFLVTFKAELKGKIFLNEADRRVCESIGSDYVLKRRLVDTIQAKDVDVLSAILGDLDGERLQNLLDRPIDDLHNTVLHRAVTTRFEAGVQVLMQHGAKSSLRNLRGDCADQWFMWPRLGRAAAAARKIRHGRFSRRKVVAGCEEHRVISVVPKTDVLGVKENQNVSDDYDGDGSLESLP
jgi:hypothetical protein